MQHRDWATAVTMAQAVLQHDPLEKGDYGMGGGLRKLAINALISSGKIDSYLSGLSQELAKSPDSARLNLLMAEAYARAGNSSRGGVTPLPSFATPAWLKLVRKGDTFTSFWSPDGQTWQDVFTRFIPMEAVGLIGLIASPNSVAPAKVTWSQVRINGADAPPSWQYSDIGWQFFHSAATWRATGVVMDSPLSKTAPPFFSQEYGLVYVPVTGDAEIVAHLDSLTSQPNDGSWAGLSFRSRADQTSPFVDFFCDHLGKGHSYTHTNSSDLGARYFQKASQLLANDPEALRQIAEQLDLELGHYQANDVRVGRLTLRFPTDANQILDALPQFEQAGRLPDFVKALQQVSGAPLAGSKVLLRIGDDLALTGHPAEAEQVYRSALASSSGVAKQEVVISLVRLLLEEGRHNEAAAEFQKGFIDQTTTSWLLSFFPSTPHADMVEEWYPAASTGLQRPQINESTVPLLQLAVSAGLFHPMKEKLDGRASMHEASAWVPVDPCRVASILISILARDAGYRDALEKLMAELAKPTTAPPISASYDWRLQMAGTNVNYLALISICEQLAAWPAERAELFRIAQTDFHGQLDGTTDSSRFRVQAELPLLRTAMNAGDHATVQQVLRDIDLTMKKVDTNAPNTWPVDRTPVVSAMIAEEMFAEAAGILATWEKEAPVMNDAAYRDKVAQIKAELAFAQNQAPPTNVVYGVTTGTTEQPRLFFWQMNAGAKGNSVHRGFSRAYRSDVLWSDMVPTRATGYSLDLVGGTPAQPLAGVATTGSAPLEVAPGASSLQALLRDPVATVPVAVGDAIPLTEGDNLLKNPRFEVSKDAQGQPGIAGWRGILPWQVTEGVGGPMPSGGFQIVEAPSYRADMGAPEIASEPVPLQRNTEYIFSAWQHDGMEPDFLFLDASGAELRRLRALGAERHALGWQWCAWRISSTSEADIMIPPSAVSVQIVFSHRWKVADVSLRAATRSTAP